MYVGVLQVSRVDFVAQKWCTIVEIVHYPLVTSLGFNLPEILLQI